VSHIPQRKEKDCLNCGTIVQGNFCQHCGQENVVPHETFWHMVKHFLYDITHFDSKFFDSMKYLLLKPGFLPTEYIKGKRAGYLNPVKKYVFTSAIFFLIFFSLLKPGESISINMDKPLTEKERAAYIIEGENKLQTNPENKKWEAALQALRDTSRIITEEELLKQVGNFKLIDLGGRDYANRREYDSIQQTLTDAEKDGWIRRRVQYQNLKMQEEYRNDPRSGTNKLMEVFLHKLPYLLFVSLPLFALILKLLYIRRKNFYYADHGIFSIYHYIFSFMLLLIVFASDKLSNLTGIGVFDFLTGIVFLSGGVYLYMSMKKFYGQGHGKTFLKFLLLNICGLLIMFLLFIIFLIFSVFQI
jgi:Protein of unknown function (DUF3667)